MSKREINPRIIREISEAYGMSRGQVDELVRRVLRIAQATGIYGGEYERPMRHLVPPEFVGRNGRTPKYPFYKMEPGDVYFFPREERSAALNAMRCHANRYKDEKKFTHAPDGDGVRIWRVE